MESTILAMLWLLCTSLLLCKEAMAANVESCSSLVLIQLLPLLRAVMEASPEYYKIIIVETYNINLFTRLSLTSL